MAKAADNTKKAPAKDAQSSDKKTSAGGTFKWFLVGGLLGLLIGVVTGWMIRPPDSFKAEELRVATEKKFLEAKDSSRDKLADFAEGLAERLREEAE